MKGNVSIKWLLFFAFYLAGGMGCIGLGLVWFHHEESIRRDELVKRAELSLKPILMVAETSIGALNYYILTNEDFLRLFNLEPALQFFSMEGTSDLGEPFEFSYSPLKKIGEYTKYPKLLTVLPEDTPERKAKKEEKNQEVIRQIEQYRAQIREFERPVELSQQKLYIDAQNNRLYVSVPTKNKNSGVVWASFDASELTNVKYTVAKKVLLLSLVGMIILLLPAVFISQLIARPLQSLVNQISQQIERLDLSRPLHVACFILEIRQVVESMNAFNQKLGASLGQIQQIVKMLTSSSADMSTISKQMSMDAEITVVKSTAVAVAAEEMTSSMNSVAASTEEAAANMGTIAAFTEEMTSTIADIAKNAAMAKDSASNAVVCSLKAFKQVNELGSAAAEIGAVTETIKAISDKTNLLALNATIEAARAGEAGKGFAVVAGEIKGLAQQTASATGHIAAKLKNIQKSTGATITVIEEVSQAIGTVDELVGNIASSVEEQNVTTSGIAGNISQAGTGIQEISENVNQGSRVSAKVTKEISEVNAAAGGISHFSTKVQQNAENLATTTEHLKSVVDRFRI